MSKIRNRLGSIFNLVLFSLGGQRDVTAEQLTNRVVLWLNTCSDSFLLWPHFMDVHYPYLPPSRYVRKLGNRRISRYQMTKLHTKQLKTFREADFRKVEWLSPAEIDTLATYMMPI